jgi:hypothetical protein
MAKYLVLARSSNVMRPEMSPAEIQRIIQKYKDWSTKLYQAGKVHDSNKLVDREGRVVRRRGEGLDVTDGPYAESKELLGGYWMIEAGSYDEAIQLLSDSPHLGFGGSFEVRRVEVLG